MNRKNILDLIGNTPLVPIKRLNPFKKVLILAKMESFNPGGSVKDRIALSMIEGAEERGELTRERIILEASSGNTGIGLAMVSAVKGYRCLIAMSEGASLERREIMRAYGAEILLTPAHLGTDGAIETVYEMAREAPERYFPTDQFNNPDNWKAHYNTTANEIWEQTEGRVDVIISTMGTTGTLMGITRRIRELGPKVRIVGVEPYLGHRLQGLKNMKESYKPGIFDKHLPDSIVNVDDEEAFEMTRRLAREEGIFVGMSSGAAMAIALKEASRLNEGLIVVIFPDGGERYLSTGVFSVERKEEEGDKVLKLTNTLTRKKELFEPIMSGKAGIYSCGPTAYQYAHLGLCRRVVFADLVRRVLEERGYEVTHVMNITDIDDKTISASIQSGMELSELTQKYIKAFLEDVDTLGVKLATSYPLATEHVEDMIHVAQRLIEKGYAYVKHGSVYFDISKLPSYGRLSRVDLSSIHVGKTVDLDEYEKDSPVDFTLFKRVTLDELKRGIGFESPWGKVRPGWHIECVAMSMRHLGDFFDIHTSGSDLKFPHHENEIAMATALTGSPLARVWLHSELVFVDGKKMSRSAGNTVTLRDILEKGFTGREVRYFLIRTNYRKPVNFSWQEMENAKKALGRIDNFMSALEALSPQGEVGEGGVSEDVKELTEVSGAAFNQAINDDLNVSMALGAIFGMMKEANTMISEGRIKPRDAAHILMVMEGFNRILQVFHIKEGKEEVPSHILKIAQEREKAREKRDWDLADLLREELHKMGFEVIDLPGGFKLKPL